MTATPVGVGEKKTTMMTNLKGLLETAIDDAFLMEERWRLAATEMKLFQLAAAEEARKQQVCELIPLCERYIETDKSHKAGAIKPIIEHLKDITGKSTHKDVKVYCSGYHNYSFIIEFTFNRKMYQVQVPDYPNIKSWDDLTYCNMGKYTFYKRENGCMQEVCSDYNYTKFKDKVKEIIK